LDDLAVPFGGADVGGEEGAEAFGEVDFVAGGADGGDDVFGFYAEVEAEEAVEALGEIALVGLGESAGEMVANFREEAREVKEAEGGVREVGRGQVEEDFAGVVTGRLGSAAGGRRRGSGALAHGWRMKRKERGAANPFDIAGGDCFGVRLALARDGWTD